MKKTFFGALAGALSLCAAVETSAQGFYLPTADYRLREDIGLLVDESIIELPVNTWPLPAADVRAAVSRVQADRIDSVALQSALSRVLASVAVRADAAEWRLREISLTAGESGLLRDATTLGRDAVELKSAGGTTNDRWSLTLAVTGVGSPDDGKNMRMDGSELSLRWGNWLFSANQIERWWGPGQGGGLILSTNARPMPGVSLGRIRSTPSDFPILRWLGPWRFTAFLNAMESERPDVDRALFLGMRASFKPVSIVEIGLSRTAQFCGRNLPCDLATFGRVLIGQDNADYRGLDPEDEPGNQMGGFDMRVVSPFRSLPIAIYSEQIGEDGSNTGIPTRFLGLFGAEAWWLRDSGAIWRTRIEYANTNCKWHAPGTSFANCAYRQAIFQAGYRYRSRNIGHTTDADAESTVLQGSLTQADGTRWGATIRRASLDRYAGIDPYNPLTQGPSDYESAEFSWSGRVLEQDLAIQLGFEQQEGGSNDRSGAFGFIQWRKSL